ncbi:MAG: alpha-amylase family glycosyl hydrolase [Bacteroidota bacterium]
MTSSALTKQAPQPKAAPVLTQKKLPVASRKPSSTPSLLPARTDRMGATAHAKGVSFRVWAPNATAVFVAGTFNNWSESQHALVGNEQGQWSGELPEAKVGDEYKYVICNGKDKMMRNDPYAREVTDSDGNSRITNDAFDWEEDHFQMPAWNELVIYELHVGTFNVKQEGKPGDLYGVIEKLPYLRELGINAIEIMPLAEFPGGFSWGYNPSHPFAVENQYGGPKAFKEFIKEAHRHGIAVLLDVVYNHFGPDRLDLWRFDGWHENEGGGIYFYNDWRAETPWGATRPDYGRGEVRQYILDNAMMWLDEFRLDGLRLDSVSHIRNVVGRQNDLANDIGEGWSLLQWLHEEVEKRFPWKIIIAEDLCSNEWVTCEIQDGGAGFKAQWDACFVNTIRETLITPNDEDRDMEVVREAIEHQYNGDSFRRVIYTESHDEVANGSSRLAEEIGPGQADSFFSKKKSTLGAALVLTTPGVPMIFQGQEFLEDEYFDDKKPLEWSRTETFNGLVELYRNLIRLRRNWQDNTRGLQGQHVQVFHVNQEQNVIAYHRWKDGGPGDSVVIVANFSNQGYENYRIGFPASGMWRMRLNTDWEGYDQDFNNQPAFDTEAQDHPYDVFQHSGNISIGAYSVIILSQ